MTLTTTTQHPACCKDPDNCELSYADHLRGVGISAYAIPNRATTKTPGSPDEPAIQTHIREKRWERDNAAFRRLHKDGLTPPQIDGSALREREGKTEYDITQRPVTIDRSDPR